MIIQSLKFFIQDEPNIYWLTPVNMKKKNTSLDKL